MRRAFSVLSLLSVLGAALAAMHYSLRGVRAPEPATFQGQRSAARTGPAAAPSPTRHQRGGAWGRRFLTLLGVTGVALVGVSAWAFLSAGSMSGSSAQGVAASVDRVTGLAFGAGGITPTADPDVPLAWSSALLSNGHAIDGYLVRRHAGATAAAVCGSDPTPLGAVHCTDSSVPDGTYGYGVSARFESWTGPESSRLSVTVDTSAPSIDGAPQSPSADASPSFTFSHPSYSTFKCRIDGAASFASCTSPDALSGLGGGSHTFRVEAVDGNGVATQVAVYHWTIDASPPALGGTPSDPSAETSPSLAFSDTSYAAFRCDLDGAGFGPCSSPDPLSGLPDGSHTFKVEALDADLVPTHAAIYSWTVSTAAPAFTTEPSNPSAATAPAFAFSHDRYSSFVCRLDGGGSYDSGQCSPGGLGAGGHTLDVEAEAADGSLTAAATYAWTVDASAPSITAAPHDPSANPAPSFSFSHVQSGYTFECRLDGGGYGACTSPQAYSGLADGGHELDVEALDADGAATAAAVYTWTIDTSPPTIAPTTAMVAGGTYASQSAGFTFGHSVYSSFECLVDGGSFAACAGDPAAAALWPSTYRPAPTDCGSFGSSDANSFCTIDDNGSVELGVKFTSSQPVNVVGVRMYRVDAGAVTGSLWSADGTRLAGPAAFGGTATNGWQDVMFATPVPITPGQTYIASYSAPDADYAYQYDFFTSTAFTEGPVTALQSFAGDGNGAYCYAGGACTFPTDTFRDSNYWVTPLWAGESAGPTVYGSLADGAHTVTAAAVDADGVRTGSATFSWTVDHAAPTVTSGPSSPTGSTSASFAFSEAPYSHFECKLDTGGFAPCDDGTASYTGLDGSGPTGTAHTLTVHAVDSLGSTTADRTFTWTVDTTAPTVDVEPAEGESDSPSSQPIHFTATFDEPVNAFSGGISLGGTSGHDSATVTVTQTTPSVYDIAVSGLTSGGTLTVSLDAGATTDPAGNASAASTSTGGVTYTP